MLLRGKGKNPAKTNLNPLWGRNLSIFSFKIQPQQKTNYNICDIAIPLPKQLLDKVILLNEKDAL